MLNEEACWGRIVWRRSELARPAHARQRRGWRVACMKASAVVTGELLSCSIQVQRLPTEKFESLKSESRGFVSQQPRSCVVPPAQEADKGKQKEAEKPAEKKAEKDASESDDEN